MADAWLGPRISSDTRSCHTSFPLSLFPHLSLPLRRAPSLSRYPLGHLPLSIAHYSIAHFTVLHPRLLPCPIGQASTPTPLSPSRLLPRNTLPIGHYPLPISIAITLLPYVDLALHASVQVSAAPLIKFRTQRFGCGSGCGFMPRVMVSFHSFYSAPWAATPFKVPAACSSSSPSSSSSRST